MLSQGLEKLKIVQMLLSDVTTCQDQTIYLKLLKKFMRMVIHKYKEFKSKPSQITNILDVNNMVVSFVGVL